MAAKYVLKLAEEERQYLSEIAKGRRGKQAIAQWKVTRAKALLKCDQGELGPAWGDRHIADALDVTERSIQNWRKRAVLDGPETALVRKLRSAPPVTPKVDGRVEAHLTKLACSTPPKGRNRWTLRLLVEKVVELELVDSLSHETNLERLLWTGQRNLGGVQRVIRGNQGKLNLVQEGRHCHRDLHLGKTAAETTMRAQTERRIDFWTPVFGALQGIPATRGSAPASEAVPRSNRLIRSQRHLASGSGVCFRRWFWGRRDI